MHEGRGLGVGKWFLFSNNKQQFSHSHNTYCVTDLCGEVGCVCVVSSGGDLRTLL
jgi:hypothetical protein